VPLSRRRLLTHAAGASVAAPLLTMSGSAHATSVGARRFPGDPGRGRLYYGAFLPYPRSVEAWEERVLERRLSVRRGYYQARNPQGLIENARNDHRHRRLPMLSITSPDDWASIARGRQDRWIGHLMDGLAPLRQPVLLIVHHEPENDAGAPGMSPWGLQPDAAALDSQGQGLDGQRDDRSGAAALDVRPPSKEHQSRTVDRRGSCRLRHRRVQPMVALQRPGMAQPRTEAGRSAAVDQGPGKVVFHQVSSRLSGWAESRA